MTEEYKKLQDWLKTRPEKDGEGVVAATAALLKAKDTLCLQCMKTSEMLCEGVRAAFDVDGSTISGRPKLRQSPCQKRISLLEDGGVLRSLEDAWIPKDVIQSLWTGGGPHLAYTGAKLVKGNKASVVVGTHTFATVARVSATTSLHTALSCVFAAVNSGIKALFIYPPAVTNAFFERPSLIAERVDAAEWVWIWAPALIQAKTMVGATLLQSLNMLNARGVPLVFVGDLSAVDPGIAQLCALAQETNEVVLDA